MTGATSDPSSPPGEEKARTAGPPRGRRRAAVGLAGLTAALLGVLGVVVATDPGGPDPGSSPSPRVTAGQRGVYPTFGPDDVFAVDVSTAPVHPASDAMIRNLRGQIEPNYGGVVGLNTTHYNPVLYVVDETTPRTTVRFDDCQKKGYTPTGLFDGAKQFVDVPVPTDARTSVGTDSTITLWSPSTDQLWEFWVMKRRGDAWSACWGGRIDHVSQSRGYFPAPFGISASGLVTTGSMITPEEARTGRIEHAMALALIAPARWDRVWYPAQRSDGVDPSPDAIPEGARLRLDPTVDVDSLDLTPLGAAIAKAAQKYGFIVVDKAGAVAVMAESTLPEQKAGKPDPWKEILGDVPHYAQLKNFPWDRMQVVEKDYAEPSDATP